MLLNYVRNNFLVAIFNICASTGKIIAFIKYDTYVS